MSHFDGSEPDLNADDIGKSLASHEAYEVKKGYVMKNLPKFDELTAYGKTENKELLLWRSEVQRLVRSSNSRHPPCLQDLEWFGKADRDGHTRLHKLAIQLRDALDMCVHDNELILIEHMPSHANYNDYALAHQRLLREYNPEERRERYERQLRLDSHNDMCYHALVDYITSMALRMLLRTMRGKFWEDNCVIVMAKFASKLKVLVTDLGPAAATCLGRAEACCDGQFQCPFVS